MSVLHDQNDTTIHSYIFINKAVSDVAISFYLDHTRFSKFIYGSFIHIPYDSSDPGHQYRSQNVFTSTSGARRLRCSFSTILRFLPKVSCLFSFFKSLSKSFEKPLFVAYPSFRDKGIRRILLLASDSAAVYEYLSFLFCVIVETLRIQCGQTLLLVSPLFITISLASFSFQVPQNRGNNAVASFSRSTPNNCMRLLLEVPTTPENGFFIEEVCFRRD